MSLEQEPERIRRMYAEFDRNPALTGRWAPFSEVEAAYRAQQTVALAALFRQLGRSSLGGQRVLDVGCGQGRLLRVCLDLGAAPADLAGVDLRPAVIAEARRLSPNIDFRVSDGLRLDFADQQFDLVMEWVVFSSIFSAELRRELAAEMARVLRPGGHVFWWDLHRTVESSAPAPLEPAELFPGWPQKRLQIGPAPLPSTCVRRRWQPLVKFLDRFRQPASHLAALIGPKP